MNREKLKEILYDQEDDFNNKGVCIDRDIELNEYIHTSLVIVISGVRRCGKSTLLYLIKEKMKLDTGDYLYFNFDDERAPREILLFNDLHNLFKELYNKEPVFFFDEIQNIEGWEKFVNRMYEKGLKLFVTGSNARLLSSEISTSLTGRNRMLKLYPFSFREYLNFESIKYNLSRVSSSVKSEIKSAFNFYSRKGGFPLVDKEDNLEIINSYFQDILYRDIIVRYKITNIKEIREIGLYLISNISRLFSYSTLQKISGLKSLNSIKNYLDYFNQSYLFFYLKKFDYSVRKQTLNPKKVYVIDQAFATRIGFKFSANKGRILENIVFLELKRREKEIFYHYDKNECDFIIKEGLAITNAIQVCYDLNTENEKREKAGVLEAMNKYKLNSGLILTYDQEDEIQIEKHKVKIIPVWKWLIVDDKKN